MNLLQVNLQAGFGGGEIYTCFFGKALRDIGIAFDLVVNERARWWQLHDTGAARIHAVRDAQQLLAEPFPPHGWIIYHTPDRGSRLTQLKARGFRVASFVHMPLYQRDPSVFEDYDLLIPVSDYVRSGLLESGLSQTYDDPLYGVADLDRGEHLTSAVIESSRYEWDTRKGRDRLFSWIYPVVETLRTRRQFTARAGLNLGVVSRITPIKQFPELFKCIAPVIESHSAVNLDIFGSGGYASIRDTQRQLVRLGSRVRWWGQQRDVRQIYPLFDFLLTGLPEKEALGLNVIESQLCGTPVLAPDAPPFQETIAHAATGFLYPDPRVDGGIGFDALLRGLVNGSLARPDPLAAPMHLRQFSYPIFRERVAKLVDRLHAQAT